MISCKEYTRLLNENVQMKKFKEESKSKSSKIKLLKTQLAYYKRQVTKRNGGADVPIDDENADLPNVL